MIYNFTEQEIVVNKHRENGKTFKEISELLNVHPNRAREIYVKYKRKEKYNTIIKDFSNGESLEFIALNHQYPISTVKSLIDKFIKKTNKKSP